MVGVERSIERRSLLNSNPFSRASDSFIFVYADRGGKYVAGNIRQRQRFAGHAHAVIIVVAALLAFVFQDGYVNSDFYLRVIPVHPFDGGLKIGIAGHNYHRIGQPLESVPQQVDRDVHVGLLFLRHLVFEATHTLARLTGDGAFLIFSENDFDLGQRAERLEISLVAVAPGADVFLRLDQRREKFYGYNVFIQPQRLEERLHVQPFPRRPVLENAEIPVEAVHVDGAAFFGRGRLDGVGHVVLGQKSLKWNLIFGAQRPICITTSRNCDWVIRKGCPLFLP